MQLFTRRLDAQLGMEDGLDICPRPRRSAAMKWMSVAAFGLALAASPMASAQRPDRYVDPPIVRSFNWFSVCRRRRYPGQLRQGRAQPHAPDLQRHLFRAGQDLRALPPARRHDRPRYRRAGRPGRGLEPLDQQRRRCAEAVEHEAWRAHPERCRDARSDGRCSRQAPPSGRRAMACACPMSTSGGRSPRAATACGASRPITIRPTASPT